MTETSGSWKIWSEAQAKRPYFARVLRLEEGAETELHLDNGYVVGGEVKQLLWNNADWLYAVVLLCPLPDGTKYERIILMDHVVEITPKVERPDDA